MKPMKQPGFLETPTTLKCPFKCNKGWKGEPELILYSPCVWTVRSQCAGCGALNDWDLNPDLPLEFQALFVKESYEAG